MTQPVDIEALRQLMERATRGPWEKFCKKIPWSLKSGKSGEHVEWLIGTVWNHPQIKGPAPVVTGSIGIGLDGGPPVHLVNMEEDDAALIVAAVNALPSLLTELEALRAERGRMVEAKNVILARCEALEDEASAGIDTVIANDRDETHEGGFWRGQKSTAKSIRCHLHDLTRATLKEPSQ